MLFTIETGLDPVLRELVSHLIATQKVLREALASVMRPDMLRQRAAHLVSPAEHAVGLAGLAMSQRASELLFLALAVLALALGLCCVLVVLVVLTARFVRCAVTPRRSAVAVALVACVAAGAFRFAHVQRDSVRADDGAANGTAAEAPSVEPWHSLWQQLREPHQYPQAARCVPPYRLEAGMCVLPHGTMLDTASQLVCLPGHTREIYTDASGAAATRCNLCPLSRVAQGETCACLAPFVYRDFDCRCPGNLEPNGEGGCVCPPHFTPSPDGSTQCVRDISPQSVYAFHIKSKGELRWACFETLDKRWDCAGNPNKGESHGRVVLDADDCISKVELIVDGKHQKINRLRLTTYQGRVFGWYGSTRGKHYVTHDGNGKCLTGAAMSAGNTKFKRVIFGFHPRW